MDQELVDVLAGISVAGRISEGDVMRLRDVVWSEEALAQPVVDALFDLNSRCRDFAPAWSEFLCEATEHFLLHQSAPHGFLEENGAAWLRDRIGKNGRIQSYPEMEMLVTILENAENAPDWLKAWALSEIEETIISGVGPTRDPALVAPDIVDAIEADLLRAAAKARLSSARLRPICCSVSRIARWPARMIPNG
jgi:hypothetical protein